MVTLEELTPGPLVGLEPSAIAAVVPIGEGLAVGTSRVSTPLADMEHSRKN